MNTLLPCFCHAFMEVPVLAGWSRRPDRAVVATDALSGDVVVVTRGEVGPAPM